MSGLRIEQKLRCADLVAGDRRNAGRDPGMAGDMRARYEAAMRDVAESFRAISRLIDAMTRP